MTSPDPVAPVEAPRPGSLAAPDPGARLPCPSDGPLVQAIDALLPQTQCGQCGFGGCLPYARALASGAAPINRCPPGGEAGVADLARLLGRPVLALDPACGTPRPLHVALIDESRCIGCTLCIQACPFDAIVGAARMMHTVVAAECTGCDLCLPPCPMDCIQMVAAGPPRTWTRAEANQARTRLHERERRLAQARADQEARLAARARHKLDELRLDEQRLEERRLAQRDGGEPLDAPPQSADDPARAELARRRAIVEGALERVRQRRARNGP